MFSSEPLSIGGVLDAGFKLYRQTFAPVMAIAAVGAVLVIGANLAMANAVNPQNFDPASGSGWLTLMVAYFFTVGAQTIFTLLIMHRQFTLATTGSADTVADLKRALRLVVPVTLVTFAFLVLLSVGFLFFVIPGVIIGVSMCLYSVVPIVEGRGAWGSLLRSHSLVWGGNWFRTATVVTVVITVGIAIVLTVTLLQGGAMGMAALFEPEQQQSVLQVVLSVLVFMLVYPIYSAVFLTLYHDVRLRKEGGDLESRLDALAED